MLLDERKKTRINFLFVMFVMFSNYTAALCVMEIMKDDLHSMGNMESAKEWII